MASSSTTSDLSKLTVSQLKQLCKERRITGYSKLSKNALIQKLADNNATRASVHGSQKTTLPAGCRTKLPPVDPDQSVGAAQADALIAPPRKSLPALSGVTSPGKTSPLTTKKANPLKDRSLAKHTVVPSSVASGPSSATSENQIR